MISFCKTPGKARHYQAQSQSPDPVFLVHTRDRCASRMRAPPALAALAMKHCLRRVGSQGNATARPIHDKLTDLNEQLPDASALASPPSESCRNQLYYLHSGAPAAIQMLSMDDCSHDLRRPKCPHHSASSRSPSILSVLVLQAGARQKVQYNRNPHESRQMWLWFASSASYSAHSAERSISVMGIILQRE